MTKKTTLFLTAVFFCFSAKTQWIISEIGVQPGMGAMDIEIAEGRNDGTQRIYVSSTAGNIYEWSYNGAWSNTLVTENKHPGLINMAFGDGRNDGQQRLYFNEHTAGGRIFEMSWNGTVWIENLVTTLDPQSSPTSIMVGKGRGDGIGRLYVGGAPWGVTEYTWTGNSWSMDTVTTLSYSESDGIIGNGRNDGKNRLYVNGECPIEAEYNSFWSDQYIGTCNISSWADAMHIGEGRNDGISRVYSNTEEGGKREFTWNGSSWNETLISSIGGRADVHLAALKEDGLNRLYVTGSKHWTGSPPGKDIVEYEWNTNTSNWDSTGVVVDAITGATGWVASGNGRNDDTLRMYAPETPTGKIYEITSTTPNHITPTNINNQEKERLKISPNPFNKKISFYINYSNKTEVDLSIINLFGKVVYLEKSIQTNTEKTINLEKLPNGTYILKITFPDFDYLERIIKN